MNYLHDDVGMLEGEPTGANDSATAARLTRVVDRYPYAENRVCNQQFKPGYLAAARIAARNQLFRVASGSAERAARLYLREWRRQYRHGGYACPKNAIA